MEQPLTILITETNNNLASKVGRQITSREDIMDRTRATLEVNKRAPSFGNQTMSIVGETQSTHLLQARHQRKKTMELSDKACPRLSAVPDLFEYVQCCDDETKMGLIKDVNKSHMMEGALLRDLFRSMLTLQSVQLGVRAMALTSSLSSTQRI